MPIAQPTIRTAPRRASLLATAALALFVMTDAVSAQASRGMRPEFTFGEALVNGQGAMSLADLQGKLVWVEFWGTY